MPSFPNDVVFATSGTNACKHYPFVVVLLGTLQTKQIMISGTIFTTHARLSARYVFCYSFKNQFVQLGTFRARAEQVQVSEEPRGTPMASAAPVRYAGLSERKIQHQSTMAILLQPLHSPTCRHNRTLEFI